MSRPIGLFLAGGLLGIGCVTGCSAGPGPHHVAGHRAASHRAASRPVLPPQPLTRAAASHCRRTIPSRIGPPGTTPADLFGWASSYGNGKLWAGGLGPAGVITASAANGLLNPDGSIGYKYGWWRNITGYLTISGRRLDAPAPPLKPSVPSGYGNTGFQASGVTFPTEGCWQITGKVGPTSLTFLTLVVTSAHRSLISYPEHQLPRRQYRLVTAGLTRPGSVPPQAASSATSKSCRPDRSCSGLASSDWRTR